MNSYWEWNKQNFPWHYDPSCDHNDVKHVGRFVHTDLENTIQHADKNFEESDSYSEVEFKGTAYNPQAQSIMEGYHNDITSAGFNEHNTGGMQRRNNLPELFHRMAELSGLVNPQIMFLKQPPGKAIPWHRDSYNNYRRNFAKVSDDTEVIRYLVQLNDWNWGHYVLIGNTVLHQYRLGDIHCWPEGIYHATGNVGYWPRYCLTITGMVGPDALHLQKATDIQL